MGDAVTISEKKIKGNAPLDKNSDKDKHLENPSYTTRRTNRRHGNGKGRGPSNPNLDVSSDSDSGPRTTITSSLPHIYIDVEAMTMDALRDEVKRLRNENASLRNQLQTSQPSQGNIPPSLSFSSSFSPPSPPPTSTLLYPTNPYSTLVVSASGTQTTMDDRRLSATTITRTGRSPSPSQHARSRSASATSLVAPTLNLPAPDYTSTYTPDLGSSSHSLTGSRPASVYNFEDAAPSYEEAVGMHSRSEGEGEGEGETDGDSWGANSEGSSDWPPYGSTSPRRGRAERRRGFVGGS